MFHHFYGGVHPHDEKAETHRLASVPLQPPPAQVVLPVEMHVGAPCAPCVAKGDTVKIGQVVAMTTGLGAPIHASVSGTVSAVEPRPHAGGKMVLSVVIDNDNENTRMSPLPRLPFYEELTPEEIVRRVEEAGIVGMGGAGFPTHVKLRSALGKVDTLIINGAECEPYITADHRLMLESPEAILAGTRILMRALGLSKAIIGVEGNKTDAVSALQGLLSLRGGDITVKTLRVRYPQGAERQLVQKVTGRLIPPGKLPMDVRCAVFNVATAAAIQAAVVEGRPLTERIVTVTGGGVVSSGNWVVPIGTPAAHLLECAGGLTEKAVRLLFGGPMMGIAQFDLSVPVMKGTNGLLAMTRVHIPIPRAQEACIRCGKCVAACPMHLTPVYLHQFAEAGRYRELEEYYISDCIECGACAYTCPARIPLVQSIRKGKVRLRAAKAQDEAARKGADAHG